MKAIWSRVGWKRGVSTSQEPSVRKRLFSLSWSMIASRLMRRSRGPVPGDVDDAGVEIALLAQQPLVDHVGDDVGDAAPVGRGGGVGGALDLLLRQHVPQAELDPHGAAAALDPAGDQRLRADRAPVLEIRRVARRRRLPMRRPD